ncbi:protein transport protein Sec31A-like [Sycon ciliatum]|uniref:protein transport protein Sec31A-like n=1 Tax=Sycon ciliatum TaxID=27933 RepID=UPI0031F6B829
MKVKEISRTACVAWSPSSQHPVYIAGATAANQLSANFDSDSTLELLDLSLGDGNLNMRTSGKSAINDRVHKLLWAEFSSSSDSLGLLVGGCDNGVVNLWSPSAVLSNGDSPRLQSLAKHTGAVRTMDVNPFQSNLLVSGGSASEVYITDLNDAEKTMYPGAKQQPTEDVCCVRWNRQVQHILASVCPSGRAVIWDLRKQGPIINVSDHSTQVRLSSMAWHPSVPTQIVTSSEDDRHPILQMWDLRYATSPMKVLHEHQRGVLGVSWCPHDPDLLMSWGKDCRILCWNPNSENASGEVVCELPASSQWTFDVQWCPRNPALVSVSSFDNQLKVYSVLGGSAEQTTDDFLGTQTTAMDGLKYAPKWLRPPVGARFSSGGQLVSFGCSATVPRVVKISQVVTEPEVLKRANELESALSDKTLKDFCAGKLQNAADDKERSMWQFLQGNFEAETRRHYLHLLGFTAESLEEQIKQVSTASSSVEHAETEQQQQQQGVADEDLPNFSSLQVSQPVEVASGRCSPVVSGRVSPIQVPEDDSVDGVISKALLLGNFEAAVKLCIRNNRMTDAMVLAVAGGADLLACTQQYYLKRQTSHLSKLMTAVVMRDLNGLVLRGKLSNWPQLLAALITYAPADQFASLCERLGRRLEEEEDGVFRDEACLCYICSGSLERLVQYWINQPSSSSNALALQDLVEKIIVLREALGNSSVSLPAAVTEKIKAYADLLISQGAHQTAAYYLQRAGVDELPPQLQAPPAAPAQATPAAMQQPHSPMASSQQRYMQPVQPPAQLMQPPPQHTQPPPQHTQPPPQHTQPPPQHTQPPPQHTQTHMQHPQPTMQPVQPPAQHTQPPPQHTQTHMQHPQPTMQPVQPPAQIMQPPPQHTQPPSQHTQHPLPQQPAAVVQPGLQPMQPAQHQAQPPPQTLTRPASERKPDKPWNDPDWARKAESYDPDNYSSMVRTFDEILARCQQVATNALAKRKVDDVSKRLDVLKETLKAAMIPTETLTGLTTIADLAASRNYAAALDKYSVLVSGGNFSQISGYMTGLKTLFQLAQQLRV